MFSRERNVVWKKCYMKCGVWNQMKMWSSHFEQLSHEPEKFRWLKSRSICWAHVFPWKECWGPLSHLNFSGSWDNCSNCPASARIISSFDFKHRTSYNISFIIFLCKNFMLWQCHFVVLMHTRKPPFEQWTKAYEILTASSHYLGGN